MSEDNSGLLGILRRPQVYLAFQRALGLEKMTRYLIEHHVRPRAGMTVLDIGCGPGTLAFSLPGVRYDGFDLNPEYIEFARRRFGGSGQHRFWCQRVGEEAIAGSEGRYDVVVAFSLLHHLDEDEARHVAHLARARLAPAGRFVTVDPGFVEGQHPVARFLASRDRGRNVRRPEEYKALASAVFPVVKLDVQHGLLRLPYTHVIMEMTAEPAS
jgi:2-polyprenyl-3-methyl-5-hydroxy-6-metoxy-1,4-benzoquinol methylase